MITVKQLSLVQGHFSLQNISFEIPQAAYAVIMGPSGCGKTSILEALCGLRPITAGRIVIGTRDVTRLRPAERALAYVPQDRALFPGHLVREQLAFSLIVKKYSQQAIAQRVDELSEMLNIRSLLDRMPDALSGGEAQRVALGRALAARPQVLLLDEPLSALDAALHEEMCALLKMIHEATAVTVCHVTHNHSEARGLANCMLRMQADERGQIQVISEA